MFIHQISRVGVCTRKRFAFFASTAHNESGDVCLVSRYLTILIDASKKEQSRGGGRPPPPVRFISHRRISHYRGGGEKMSLGCAAMMRRREFKVARQVALEAARSGGSGTQGSPEPAIAATWAEV